MHFKIDFLKLNHNAKMEYYKVTMFSKEKSDPPWNLSRKLLARRFHVP
ncbi:hypothetical protein LEP1GSC161_2403 [Leptospira santarosai str. CBC1416]|uniref:Uncharacterized protein n=1 Tax=Leptospira santarosai str. CBC1416 TaxID=1193059 RepID=M6WBZ6_9LEPT|nr:hypothetical protein LEP1GSC161_2403 [Leptospira santarosai str. CBC1416]